MLASHRTLFDSLYGHLLNPLAVVGSKDLQVCYANQALKGLFKTIDWTSPHISLAAMFEFDLGEAVNLELLERCSQQVEAFECINVSDTLRVFQVTPAQLKLDDDSPEYFVLQVQASSRSTAILPSSDSRLTYALTEACDGLWDWCIGTGEVFFSPKLDQMLGFDPEERSPCFESWAGLVHPDDINRVQDALGCHLRGDSESYDIEYRIYTKQGGMKQVRDRGRICRWDSEGNASRVIGMLSDITAYRELESELRETRDRFEDYALCGSDWFWETDQNLVIQDVSSQFTRQTGVGAEDIKGRNLLNLLRESEQTSAIDAVKDSLPIRNIRLAIGQQKYWIALSGRSMFDRSGVMCGYRGIGENIHDQVMLEKTVQAYKHNAEVMMDRAPAAIGMISEKGQFFYSNKAFLSLLRADTNNLSEKYRNEKQLSKPDKQVLQSDESMIFEMVMETLDGPQFYSVLKFRLNRADKNERLVVTIAMDITYTRQREVDQKKIEMVLDNIAEGILITDLDHKIVSANRSMQETTGYTLDELVGKTPSIFSSGRYDRGFYQELWNEVHQSGKWRGDIWNRCRNGSVMRQHVSIQAIMVDGQVQHYIGIYSTAFQSGIRRDSEMFAQQYDPLTSLPNRMLFQDRLHMACQRSRVRRHSVEITLVHVSNMTTLNDGYGHTVGDQVLKRVAFHLQDGLSLDDTVARYSSDEFVVIREKGLEISADELIRPVLDRPIVLGDGARVVPEYTVQSVRYPDQGANPHRLMRLLHNRE
ncbi:PAS domain S-box protein [Sansalvadorimonas sp. 2012CJ34-2]|uniref:PAS domain S-box protein n=1 Tax=Parendozoicomonas callyspongiae TaxID=2942213 RepID=A0ABT0PJ79_9GAMM|nr:PAS domain S-box protein [Sansalvadorimonas sp. 2012CJ34-2]MCL6271435.1 PAS domain S-box protein [Sansalvadorimonas sp. 2012CJ34-2]